MSDKVFFFYICAIVLLVLWLAVLFTTRKK